MYTQHPGLLCVIEGIDGAGKTTLINKIYNKFQELDSNVIITREPGATKLGKFLREFLAQKTTPICTISEFLLFASDRAQHFHELIVPALAQGTIVISDRMNISSQVYQGILKGASMDMIEKVNAWCMQNIKPDIIFYLKIDATTAVDRMKNHRGLVTNFEQEFIEKLEILIEGFETVLATNPNVFVLDGTQTIEIIAQQAFEIIQIKIQEKNAKK